LPLQMTAKWRFGFRRSAAQCFFGGIGLALLTVICFQLGLDVPTTSFAFLILLAVLSLMGSFVASGILSFAAVGCLSYFFAPPIFDFRAAYEEDVLAMAAFLTTSMIVAGLTTKRERAEEVLREQARHTGVPQERTVGQAKWTYS
jgi:K+-sensing histidine kinase KdpD